MNLSMISTAKKIIEKTIEKRRLAKTEYKRLEYADTIKNKLYAHQRKLWDYLESGGKRAICIWHRRAGKDVVAWYWTVYSAMKKVGLYWYVLPTYPMAASIIWNGMFTGTSDKFLDIIPKEWIESTNKTNLMITLVNGSIIQLKSAEDCERSLRGSNPLGVVLSEYSFMKDTLLETISPIFSPTKHDGWLLFIFTPYGKNHAYDLWAKEPKDWYKEILTINDTYTPDGDHIVTKETVDEELRRGEHPETVKREYYCSFEAGIYGTYYIDEMELVKKEERLLPLLYDRNIGSKVYTFWDLGIHDPTVIWFVQQRGDYLYFFDYYENTGKDTEYYLNVLLEKKEKHGYIYGKHILPHDAIRKDSTSASRTRYGLLAQGADNLNLGTFTMAPNIAISDGINIVKRDFRRLFFCSNNCKKGIEAISFYRQHKGKWGFEERPEHDWSSHASDALRVGLVWHLHNNDFDSPNSYMHNSTFYNSVTNYLDDEED